MCGAKMMGKKTVCKFLISSLMMILQCASISMNSYPHEIKSTTNTKSMFKICHLQIFVAQRRPGANSVVTKRCHTEHKADRASTWHKVHLAFDLAESRPDPDLA